MLINNAENALNQHHDTSKIVDEVARLSRLYNALSQINQIITHSKNRESLLNNICEVLVAQVGFMLAWVGWHNPDTQQLEHLASSGAAKDYIEKVKIYADERPEGMGPSGTAFRSESPFICNDLENDPIAQRWKNHIIQYGFASLAVFPIRQQGRVQAILGVYSSTEFYFNDQEITLIEGVTKNISFALDNLIRQEALTRAEKNIRNERRFSNTMIESMPGVLYFYDINGKFLRWNKNFETVTGYSADEIAHMHPTQFFRDEDKDMLTERIGEVFIHGEASVEADFINKKGEATPYFFTGRKVFFNGIDCLVGVGIDVTERKRAEAHLIESEKQYRELVELANSIILRWDIHGNVTFMNEFGQRFFGYNSEEIIGKKLIGTIVPATSSDGRDLPNLLKAIFNNPAAFEQNVNENMLKNGQRVMVEWTNKFVTNAEGAIVEILSIGTDITERINTQNAIQELNTTLEQRVIERTEALNVALTRAEAADKIKSAFLATMSHEFRTPLNSIIGFTGIILQGLAGPLNPEQTKQLGMVRGSAKHLLELINDVLDISKIEAGQLEVHFAAFDVQASINRVMDLMQPFATKKQLVLSSETQLDALAEMPMQSDRRRVEQILMNLINNAIKFTELGFVKLHAEVITHTFTDAKPQPTLKVCVTDSGIGIKAEDLSRLFQPFHQIDSGLTRQHEGTGLGLTICRRLATLLGGTVVADSIWMQGTTFTLLLPLYKEG